MASSKVAAGECSVLLGRHCCRGLGCDRPRGSVRKVLELVSVKVPFAGGNREVPRARRVSAMSSMVSWTPNDVGCN